MKLVLSLLGLIGIVQSNYIPIEQPQSLLIEQQDNDIKLSFIDEIFGELINNEQVLNYKMDSISKGELRYDDDNNNYIDGDNFSIKSLKNSKLTLPHDDYIEDLFDRLLYAGIITFAHLPTLNCFDYNSTDKIDIAILGAPFDTGVSYSPGARFGPNGIRQGGRRLGGGLTSVRGFKNSLIRKIDPYKSGLNIVDCGDIPMLPFDNRVALNQLYRGSRVIHNHQVLNSTKYDRPRIITLGGDHTITLMGLKSAFETFHDSNDKISVIHFDSHIDTWDPNVLGGGISNYAGLNHGTFLHYAAEAGYINKNSSLHVGIRAPYISDNDINHDIECGFKMITAREIDDTVEEGGGIKGIVKRIKDIVGDTKVYITVDIDVLDPSTAPGTGTMEVGGFTSRELISILDGLEGIDLIGADVVEVSPPFDTRAGITTLVAAQVVDSFLGLMAVKEIY
ncbi:hydrolase activity protein [[Candida] boidinii]|nr:hydrolase activity protein [[Candida] boidinii]OWB60590.1 hydrolase activity protein [[Candida] boidinii]OWB75169.1 hydrolase activity protein [[Candida] boidinii]